MSETTQQKIILVDDDKSLLEQGCQLLKDSYRVFPANSGAKLFELLETIMADLILLDISMPELNGYDVIRKLKADPRYAKIPVIFLTAKNDEESEVKGFELGAVEYVSKPFSKSVLLKRISHHINVSLQIKTMENLSMIDQLTAIANRRSFESRLKVEWGRALRYSTPIGIVMIDIDKFKLYNDTYGHQQGDTVLKEVARILQQIPNRSTDLVARYGGEEFIALLPNTEENSVVMIAENMRKEVAKAVIPCKDGSITGVTVSIGLYVMIPSKGDDMSDLIVKVDKALYNAKETGRNRVCTYK